MRSLGFEWLVAWRHLRDPDRSTHKTLFVACVLIWLGALGLLVAALAPRFLKAPITFAPAEWREARTAMWVVYLGIGAKISIGLSLIAFLLAFLFEIFTIFTSLSILGVFFGISAPIIFLSVMSGFEQDLKTKIRSTKADVIIEMRDDRPFTGWQAVEAKLAGVRDVVGMMAYIETEVIIKHATNSAGQGIILRGIDPARAPYVLGIQRMLKEGSVAYLDHPEEIPDDIFGVGGERREERRVLPGVLLGEELFQHVLRVFVGSEVDLACPTCGIGPTGPMPKLKPFRVAGHFYTGMYEFDAKLAYISLRDAQKFLGMDGEVTGIEIKTTTPEAAIGVAKEIAGILGPGYEVRSWEELNRALYGALKIEKLAAFIALCFIVLVASFSIGATLLMMVTEKAREIAILKSMGARDGAILRIFFAEGLYIGVVGLLLGVVTGVGCCLALSRYGLPLPAEVYYIEKMPIVMRVSEITAVGLAALGLCCLATIYPALLASRIKPVEGLRYE